MQRYVETPNFFNKLLGLQGLNKFLTYVFHAAGCDTSIVGYCQVCTYILFPCCTNPVFGRLGYGMIYLVASSVRNWQLTSFRLSRFCIMIVKRLKLVSIPIMYYSHPKMWCLLFILLFVCSPTLYFSIQLRLQVISFLYFDEVEDLGCTLFSLRSYMYVFQGPIFS